MTLKKITIKQAVKCHPLARAVLRQLGGGKAAIVSAVDAANHGADCGYRGFIWYLETTKFTRTNRGAIAAVAQETADGCGESVFEMIHAFKGLDDPTDREIAIALSGMETRATDDIDHIILIENSLAWFALEEVSHAILRLMEE